MERNCTLRSYAGTKLLRNYAHLACKKLYVTGTLYIKNAQVRAFSSLRANVVFVHDAPPKAVWVSGLSNLAGQTVSTDFVGFSR
jgi:hypothetical protein